MSSNRRRLHSTTGSSSSSPLRTNGTHPLLTASMASPAAGPPSTTTTNGGEETWKYKVRSRTMSAHPRHGSTSSSARSTPASAMVPTSAPTTQLLSQLAISTPTTSQSRLTASPTVVTAQPLPLPGAVDATSSTSDGGLLQTSVTTPSLAPSDSSFPNRYGSTGTAGTGAEERSGTLMSLTQKLQLQNLQAAVQAIGLDNASSGWVMLQKLTSIDQLVHSAPARATSPFGGPLSAGASTSSFHFPFSSPVQSSSDLASGHSPTDGHKFPQLQSQSAQWALIRDALATGKLHMLLPRDKLPTHGVLKTEDPVTPAMVMDHLVYVDSPANGHGGGGGGRGGGQVPVVTLSGLRGVIEGDRLVFATSGRPLEVETDRLGSGGRPEIARPEELDHLGISLAIELTSPISQRHPVVGLASAKTELVVPRQPSVNGVGAAGSGAGEGYPFPSMGGQGRDRGKKNGGSGGSTRGFPFLSGGGGGQESDGTDKKGRSGIAALFWNAGRNEQRHHHHPHHHHQHDSNHHPSPIQSPYAPHHQSPLHHPIHQHSAPPILPGSPGAHPASDTDSIASNESAGYPFPAPAASGAGMGSTEPSKGNFTLQAWAVESVLKKEEVAHSITQAVEMRTRAVLGDLDDRIVNEACGLLARFNSASLVPPQPTSPSLASSRNPFANLGVSASSSVSSTPDTRRFSIRDTDSISSLASTLTGQHTTLVDAPWEEIQEAFTDFYERVEKVVIEGSADGEGEEEDEHLRPRPRTGSRSDGTSGGRRVEREEGWEEEVEEALERVEAALCGEVYDRIFCPASSSDSKADEKLGSRIAALYMLDLSFDHLGLDLEPQPPLPILDGESKRPRRRSTILDEESSTATKEGLEDIARACGAELARLQDASCRPPAEKLAILVNTHRIIADGLSRLPPIPLKTEGHNRTSQPLEIEMSDTPSSAIDTSAIDEEDGERETEQDEDDLKTPGPRPSGLHRTQSVPEIRLPDPSTSPTFEFDLPDHTPTEERSPSRASAPVAPTPKATATSSADLVLPMLIYSVVQANPPRLMSELAYIQRYRSQALMRGEASYCLVNFHAVCEFLAEVDLVKLGMSPDKVLGFGDSSPLDRARVEIGSAAAPTRLREKVAAEVGSALGSANKVIHGVTAGIDGGYRLILGRLLGGPGGNDGVVAPGAEPKTGGDAEKEAQALEAEAAASPAGDPEKTGLPKRIEGVKSALSVSNLGGKAKGVLLKSETALKGRKSRSNSASDRADKGREMVDVGLNVERGERAKPLPTSPVLSEESVTVGASTLEPGLNADSRLGRHRLSIADRLAQSVSASLSRSPSNATVVLPSKEGPVPTVTSRPLHSRESSSTSLGRPPSVFSARASHSQAAGQMDLRIAPPSDRWLECQADDVRVSEVADLLADYRRLADALKRLDAFGPGQA